MKPRVQRLLCLLECWKYLCVQGSHYFLNLGNKQDNGIEFLGCYRDHRQLDGFDNDRAMPDTARMAASNNNHIVRTCQREALARGKRLFSLQQDANGIECRVGDDETQAKRHNPSGGDDCTTSDNQGYNTGGTNIQALYRSEHMKLPYEPLDAGHGITLHHYGCFHDGRGREPWSGALETEESRIKHNPSLVECARIAASRGKRVFGYESGDQCRWSDSVQQATVLGTAFEGECNTRDKLGKPSGGDWKFNLFEIPDESVAKLTEPRVKHRIRIDRDADIYFRGCYRPSRNITKANMGKVSRVYDCAVAAAIKDFSYFATNQHGECFLGNDPKPFM